MAFLEQFGWTVAEEPVQTQKVRVPEDPSEVFLRYNDLQLSQGYDLLSYSGKTLTRYVYQITNYPGTDGVYFATLLVYQRQRRRRRRRFQPPERCDAWFCHAAGTDYGACFR